MIHYTPASKNLILILLMSTTSLVACDNAFKSKRDLTSIEDGTEIFAAPTVTVTSTVAGTITNNNTATVLFSTTVRDFGYFECQIDTQSYTACTTPYILSDLSDSEHTFNVVAVNTRGRRSAAQSIRWRVDTLPPTTNVTSRPSLLSNASSGHFSFSATDAGSGVSHFMCSLNAAAPQSCTSPFAYSSLADGSHTFRVFALDYANNASPTLIETFHIDTVRPTATITAAPIQNSTSSNAEFSFQAFDSYLLGRAECRLDLSSYVACTSPVVYNGLADGAHTFFLRVVDAAGNISSEATHTWNISTAEPVISILSQPTNPSTYRSASFTFGMTQGVASAYQCKLDDATYGACTSPISYSSLSDGAHVFYVRAIDSWGRTSVAASYSWTVDATVPQVRLTASPRAVDNSTSANFEFVLAVNESVRYSCSLDSTVLQSCTNPVSFSGLNNGAHTFRFSATDLAGNSSGIQMYNWQVDSIAPLVTFVQAPPVTTTETNATFVVQVNEVATQIQCRLDSALNFTNCASPLYYTNLAVGAHTLSVRAVDQAGNISLIANHSWTILSPDTLVHFPTGACSTGKMEVYINNAPHPQHQFIDAEDCIEVERTTASTSLLVRCIDPSHVYAPSDFMGAAIDRGVRSTTMCKTIRRSI